MPVATLRTEMGHFWGAGQVPLREEGSLGDAVGGANYVKRASLLLVVVFVEGSVG